MAHGPSRIGKRRLGWTVPIEPGSQDASNRAVMGSDGGEQGGPLLKRSILDVAVIDRRVVAQRRPVEACGDAARTQIGSRVWRILQKGLAAGVVSLFDPGGRFFVPTEVQGDAAHSHSQDWPQATAGGG